MNPADSAYVTAAIPIAREGRQVSLAKSAVRRFEPHLDGPRRALKRIETHSLS
jgi:hypothetical protein